MSAALSPLPDSDPVIAALIASRRPDHALPRAFYHDPAIHRRDLDRVLHRHWLVAGHASQASNPGDYFTVRVDQDEVIIARDGGGRLHALLNACRHRGSEVCTEAEGNTRHFICPYHAWAYGLDGTLVGARHMPDTFDKSAHGLRRLALREEQGLVFICFAPLLGQTPLAFDEIARTLAASLGRYGWADARVAHRETYVMEANWKLSVENYVECYHCAPSHPEYSRTHALEQPAPRIAKLNEAMEARTAALGIEVATLNRFHCDDGGEAFRCFRYALYDGVESGSDDGRGIAPLMGQFTAYDGGATSIHLGGVSFMLAYPDHGVIYRFWPLGIGRSAMELIWLVRGDAMEGRDYDRERLTWLWRVTSEADKRIIEHNARGVASTFFEPGPLSPMENTENRWIAWYLNELR
jgi:Rieske 2Fe-2S family protein